MIESRNYPAFNAFPVAGPAYGPPRPTSEARFVRVLLVGPGFTARVQVSNATDNGAAPGPLFTPPDNSFQTVATLTQVSPPFDYPGPARWVRVLLDSGTILDGSIEEDTRARGISKDDVLDVVREEQPKYTSTTATIQIGDETVTGIVYTLTPDPTPDPGPDPTPTPTPTTKHTLTVKLAGVGSAPVSVLYDQTNAPIYVGPMGETGLTTQLDKGTKVRIFGGPMEGFTADPVRVVTLDGDTVVTVGYTVTPTEEPEEPPPPPTYTLTVKFAGQATAPTTILNTTVEPDLLIHQGPLTSPMPFAGLTGGDTFLLTPEPVRGFAPEDPRTVILDADKEVTLTYTARPAVSLTINLNGSTTGVATVKNVTTGGNILTNGAETIRSGHRIDAGNPNGDVKWGDTLSIEFGAVSGFETPPVQVVTLEGDVTITAPYTAVVTPTKLLQIALSGPDSAPVTVIETDGAGNNRTLFGSTMTRAQGLSFNVTTGLSVQITAASVSGYAPPNPNPRVIVMSEDASTVLSYTLQMADVRGGTGVFDPAHPLPVSDALTTPPSGTPRFTASTASSVDQRHAENQATWNNIRAALLSGQGAIVANNAVWDTKKRFDLTGIPSIKLWGEGSGSSQTTIRPRAGYTRTPNSQGDDGLVMLDGSAGEIQGIKLDYNANETGIKSGQNYGWYGYKPGFITLRNCPVVNAVHTQTTGFRGQSYTQQAGPVHVVATREEGYSAVGFEWIRSPRVVAYEFQGNGWADQASGGSGGIGPLFTGCLDSIMHTFRLYNLGNTGSKMEGCGPIAPGQPSGQYINGYVDGAGKDLIKFDTRSITQAHAGDPGHHENIRAIALTLKNKHGYTPDGTAYLLGHNVRGGLVEDILIIKEDTISPGQTYNDKGIKFTNGDGNAKNVVVRKVKIVGVSIPISNEGHLDATFEDVETDQSHNFYGIYSEARCTVRRAYCIKRGAKDYTAVRVPAGSTVEDVVAIDWDYAVANDSAAITANRVTAVNPRRGIFSNPGGVTGSNNVTATTAPPSPVQA